MTEEQERLKAMHGTPAEFAVACIDAIGEISRGEAASAVIRYLAQWEEAGRTRGGLQKIAMGAKPDPFKFEVVSREVVNGNMIVVARYFGCLTFDGLKMMLLRGEPEIGETLDPHFLDEEYPVVARFTPNETGWKLARACALLV